MNGKQAYFDGMADRWDEMVDVDSLRAQLNNMLDDLRIRPDEHILDLGCGTGNLTALLVGRLSYPGSVVAVDFAPGMVRRARAKIGDSPVSWLVADAHSLPLATESLDRVICFSAWPHFDEPGRVAKGIARILKRGGSLEIFHAGSREEINGIHVHAGGAIERDLLPPASDLGAMLRRKGFREVGVVENGDMYHVRMQKG